MAAGHLRGRNHGGVMTAFLDCIDLGRSSNGYGMNLERLIENERRVIMI